MKILIILITMLVTMTYALAEIKNDLPLKYLEAAHPNSKDKPLIIFMHGYGSNEEDLFELKQEFSSDYNFLSVRAPMTLAPGSYQWYQMPGGSGANPEDLKNAAKVLEDFIKAAVTKYHTQNDKVVLVGFSQGAIISFELALRKPELVRGIVALSGKILPGLQSEIKPGLDLKNLGIFIGHGSKDDRIRLSSATEANDLLMKTSVKPAFHSYPGMGHSINQAELTDMKNWVLKLLEAKR